MIKEPRRLIEVPSELAESLAASQLRLPSDARMAALAARLAGTGVVMAEPVRTPIAREVPHAAPASENPLELSAKAVVAGVGLGVVALVGALAWRYALPHTNAQPAPVERAPVSVAAALPAPPVLPARAPVPTAPAADNHAPVALGDERAAMAAPAALAVSENENERAERMPRSTAEVAAPAALAPPTAQPAAANASAHSTLRKVEPEPKRAALSAPLRAGGAVSNGEAPSLPANTVIDSEVEMLKKARSALGSDSLEAFALSERCRAQYPNGAFTQEREFIGISALIRLGRRDEARNRASLFRTHYRNSAYLPQLTRMLGEE